MRLRARHPSALQLSGALLHTPAVVESPGSSRRRMADAKSTVGIRARPRCLSQRRADFIMERDAAQAGKMIVGQESSSTIHGQAVRDMQYTTRNSSTCPRWTRCVDLGTLSQFWE